MAGIERSLAGHRRLHYTGHRCPHYTGHKRSHNTGAKRPTTRVTIARMTTGPAKSPP